MNRVARWAVLGLALAAPFAARSESLPGMRGTDHISLTVPNLKEAVDFFTGVLGCEAFFKLGPFKATDDWMQVHLNVDPRAEIPTMQLVRCGSGTNYELMEWAAPDKKTTFPRNSDLGGHHVAFYVDDIGKAVAYLKSKNIKFQGEPTVMKEGPSAGETWVYFLAPWGTQLELVSYPNGKAYQKDFKNKLWNAAAPGN
jgi:catechol 2,3-dioxygenase-like lactoylglutathione lyase family enzyme